MSSNTNAVDFKNAPNVPSSVQALIQLMKDDGDKASNAYYCNSYKLFKKLKKNVIPPSNENKLFGKANPAYNNAAQKYAEQKNVTIKDLKINNPNDNDILVGLMVTCAEAIFNPDVELKKDKKVNPKLVKLDRLSFQIVEDFKWVIWQSKFETEKFVEYKSLKNARLAQEKRLMSNIRARDIKNAFKPELDILREPQLRYSLEALFQYCFAEAQKITFERNYVFNLDLNEVANPKTTNNRNPQIYDRFADNLISVVDQVFTAICLVNPKENFIKQCEYEAINDLLMGSLHRLDPTIGDAGCQFRIPMVLDSHEALVKKFMSDNAAKETMLALGEYYQYLATNSRLDTMCYMARNHIEDPIKTFVNIYKEFDINWNEDEEKTDNRPGNKNLEVNIKWQGPDYSRFKYFEAIDLDKIPNYKKLYNKVVEYISKLNEVDVRGFSNSLEIKNSHQVPFDDSFNEINGEQAHYLNSKNEKRSIRSPIALRALTLCKALTVRQLRCMDRFCLPSHDPSLDLPFCDLSDMSELKAEMAWYSVAYLTNSFRNMAYSKYAEDMTGYEHTDDKIPEMAYHLTDTLESTRFYYRADTAKGLAIDNYENRRLLYMYCFVRGWPIVVDLKRIQCTPGDKAEIGVSVKSRNNSNNSERKRVSIVDASYEVLGREVFCFIPNKNTMTYDYVPDNEVNDWGNKPALTYEGYSMYNPATDKTDTDIAKATDFEDFKKLFLKKYDIFDMMFIAAHSHKSFPSNSIRPNGYEIYGNEATQNADESLQARPVSRNEDEMNELAATQPLASNNTAYTSVLREESTDADRVTVYDKALQFTWDRYVGNDDVEEINDDSDNFDIYGSWDEDNKLRSPLPLFGNRLDGKTWTIMEEQKSLKKLDSKVGYTNYAYRARADQNQTEDVRIRTDSTYVLASIHMYGCTYNARKENHKVFWQNWGQEKLKTRVINDDPKERTVLIY